MTTSKFRALEHAAKEIKDYCGQIEVCEDCLFEQEYLICPFRREPGLPYTWKFEKKCEKEGMVKHGKWVEESRKADGIFDLYQTFIICSICGNEHYYGTGDKPNFCDNCGAKMDLEE